eukprot:750009-Hanusia_phi.AAC.1
MPITSEKLLNAFENDLTMLGNRSADASLVSILVSQPCLLTPFAVRSSAELAGKAKNTELIVRQEDESGSEVTQKQLTSPLQEFYIITRIIIIMVRIISLVRQLDSGRETLPAVGAPALPPVVQETCRTGREFKAFQIEQDTTSYIEQSSEMCFSSAKSTW